MFKWTICQILLSLFFNSPAIFAQSDLQQESLNYEDTSVAGLYHHDKVAEVKILNGPVLFVEAGTALNLTCTIEGNPKPVEYVTWYYGNTPITSVSHKGLIRKILTDKNSSISQFHIANLQLEESGNYTCAPHNNSHASVVLYVLKSCLDSSKKLSRRQERSQSLTEVYNPERILQCVSNCLPKGGHKSHPEETYWTSSTDFSDHYSNYPDDITRIHHSPHSEPLLMHVENCVDIHRSRDKAPSGIYKVQPSHFTKPIDVYCDMDSFGGGWTVFQRRMDVPGNEEYFMRNWTEYKKGFGDLKKEFWLGNDNLYALTKGNLNALLIDLEDFEHYKRHARYDTFQITDESKNYTLTVSGYTGDAGDDLKSHTGHQFSTFDHENSNKCATKFKGGFWYQNCHHLNINGLYLRGKHSTTAIGVNSFSFKGHAYSLKFTEMKFRPKGYLPN